MKTVEEDFYLNKLLAKSCSVMYDYAMNYCTHDYVDEISGCSWYHTAWQFLRVLNCVSAPQWHHDFYKNSIESAIKDKDSIKILVSGTADYSMLHLIVDTVTQYDKRVEITIVDKCKTPLKICKWYEDVIREGDETLSCLALSSKKRENFIKNISIVYVNNDVFRLDNSYSNYNIICTDAFLTRFERAQASKVINLWKQSLCKDGVIITTVRIHDMNSESSAMDIVKATRDIFGFSDKVLLRYHILQDKTSLGIDAKQLDFLANRYIIQMQSFNLGTKDEIAELFQENGFMLTEDSETGMVEGEISTTWYYRIVAKLNSD